MNNEKAVMKTPDIERKTLTYHESIDPVKQCFFENESLELELRINDQYNQFLNKQNMLIMPENLITMKINSERERVAEVSKALAGGIPYLNKNIYPKLEKLAIMYGRSGFLDYLKECAKGSYLIHIPAIQDYYVIKHYFRTDMSPSFYVIAVKDEELYGFGMDSTGCVRFGIFDKCWFGTINLGSDTNHTIMKVRDIVDEYGVPQVEKLPRVFENVFDRIQNQNCFTV